MKTIKFLILVVLLSLGTQSAFAQYQLRKTDQTFPLIDVPIYEGSDSYTKNVTNIINQLDIYNRNDKCHIDVVQTKAGFYLNFSTMEFDVIGFKQKVPFKLYQYRYDHHGLYLNIKMGVRVQDINDVNIVGVSTNTIDANTIYIHRRLKKIKEMFEQYFIEFYPEWDVFQINISRQIGRKDQYSIDILAIYK